MNRIPLLLTLSLVVAGSVHADANRSNLRARGKAFIAAWNAHDASAMANLWAPDGDVINPMGQWGQGRDEIEALFEKEHSTMMAESTISLKTEKIRFLEPDVAVIDWDITLRGMKLPNGDTHPALDHHVTTVAVKRDGEWWYASCRPYVFLTGQKQAECTANEVCPTTGKRGKCPKAGKAEVCPTTGKSGKCPEVAKSKCTKCTSGKACAKCAAKAAAKTCPKGKSCGNSEACKDGPKCGTAACTKCKH